MSKPAEGSELRPFRAELPQADIDDLQARLAQVRWPDELPGPPGRYGVPLEYVRELVEHWRTAFDWRDRETRLNAHPQFATTIDGQSVHFIHVRSPEPDALALICTHGWPMSVFEYLDLIGPLSDPRACDGDPTDAFHLVIPSVPGVAFSGPTTGPGWDTQRIARAWVELMARLGYERYGAHGNDAGSLISPEVGRHDPERVVGVHVTQLFSFPSGDPAEFAAMNEDDKAAMQFLEQSPPPRRPELRSSPRTSSQCGASPSATTPTSSAGTATSAAATSHPMTPRTSYSTTSAASSASCANRTTRTCSTCDCGLRISGVERSVQGCSDEDLARGGPAARRHRP